MDTALRSETLDALRKFRYRRSSLLRRCGWLAALVGMICLLLLVALLDRLWLLPDSVRPWFSLAAYAGCLLLGWRAAWRFTHSLKGNAGAARAAEACAPELREKLLSAVELAEADESQVKDSPEFRAKLQEEVAGLVKGIDWRRRQPATLLWPWVKAAAIAVAVVALLSFVPRLHLPGFLARAALPFANLERPSSVTILVEHPVGAETLAPIGSEVDVTVRIEGEDLDKVLIEHGDVGHRTSRMELNKSSPGLFTTRLPVGQNDVRFRILASDGMSAWHHVGARPRPRITQFVKVINPPAYVSGSPITLTEDHGDIEALEGSTVTITMTANQPLAEAVLLINPEMADSPPPVAVKIIGEHEVQTELKMDSATEAWTIRLKSKETGFDNGESTPWRMTALPDLPPVVQIIEPAESQVSLLPDESLRLAGLASDDIGLAEVKLATALNGAAWKEEPLKLPTEKGKEAIVEHLLSLPALLVKAGDTILLKLIANDLKGQKAESTPLRLVILEQTVDPAKRAFANEQRRLAEMSQALAERTRSLTKDASELQKVHRDQKKGKEAPDAAETKLANFQQSLESARAQAEEVWEQVKRAAQAAHTPLDAEETRLIGERLVKLRRDALTEIESLTRNGIEHVEAVKKAAGEANSEANLAADAARAFATESLAKIAAQSAQQMARQQGLLTDTSLAGNRDAAQRPQWQEQQRAALVAQETVGKDFEALKEHAQGGHKNNLERMKKEIDQARNELSESLDKPADPQSKEQPQIKTPEHFYGASDNLRQRMQRASEGIRNIADEAARRAQQVREGMANRGNPALAALDKAENELNEAAAIAKDPKRSANQKLDKQGQTAADRAQDDLALAGRQLQDQAELREQNPLTNTEAALDANRASRAAEKMRERSEHAAIRQDATALAEARESVGELARVARTLETDAKAQEAKAALMTASQTPDGDAEQAVEVAEAAQQAAEQLRQIPQAANRLKANDIAVMAQQAADQARNAAQQLGEQARQAVQRPPQQPVPPTVPAPPSLSEALAKTEQVAQMLAQQSESARQKLEAMAPKVSEMMNEVAESLRETQQKTEGAQKEAEAQKPVQEVAEEARALQPEAASDASKMESLQAALRQEANAAKLERDDQRQLARTADVALESMRQKSPQIQSNLKQAQQAQQSQPQAAALQRAAQAQKQTADALQQLAQSFSKMEAGQEVPQENLDQLAQMEQQLGVQEALQEAYNQAQELAAAAQDAKSDPQKALAELEQQLARSPAMQKALADIAKDTAQSAQKSLAEKANQPAMLGSAAEDAGHQLQRVARHQKRLGQEQAATQVADAGNKLQETAKATKTEPGNATPQVAQEATQASQAAAEAAQKTSAQSAAPSHLPATEQIQATAMAQALDQLDAALHPMNSAPQPGEQSQQNQQGQASAQQAQDSLSQAQKAQQQSMAQARAQGKVPGQGQNNQQAAQQNAKKSQNPSDSAQSSEDGGNYTTVMKDGQMVLVPVGAIDVTDWGRLPARMAEDLTEATRQEAAPEYRAAIESYYKAIAEKAKR